jgi:hypothetical protein
MEQKPKRKSTLSDSSQSLYSSIKETTTKTVNHAIKKGKRQIEKLANLDILSQTENPDNIVIEKVEVTQFSPPFAYVQIETPVRVITKSKKIDDLDSEVTPEKIIYSNKMKSTQSE